MNREPVFEARNLEYRFEDAAECAVRNASFTIYSGETVAIVGPNGTGKSTLLAIMLGFLKDYRGSLTFFGRQISEFGPGEMAALRGFVPQENEAGLRMSVADYIRLSRPDPSKAGAAEIASILEEAGIARLAGSSMASLSGGEARMAQLAFTLSRKPRVLLLDEPISFLDVSNQKKMLDAVRAESVKNGTTVVAILHDLNAAAYYADRIMLVGGGEIVKFGPPHEVVNYRTLGSLFFAEGDGRCAEPAPGEAGLRAHVICGGGSGAEIIKALLSAGFSVTAGVLNAGDSDWNLCLKQGIMMAEEEPFRGITDENYAANVSFIRQCDVVVVCEFPLGAGNLRNLKFIEEKALCEGKTILSCLSGSVEHDYTGGLAAPLIAAINGRSEHFSDADSFRAAIKRIASSKKNASPEK